jgi:hypothetical protein
VHGQCNDSASVILNLQLSRAKSDVELIYSIADGSFIPRFQAYDNCGKVSEMAIGQRNSFFK